MVRDVVSLAIGLAALLPLPGCSALPSRVSEERPASRRVTVDHPSLPLKALSERELDRFQRGDALFEASLRESDGLGPLYVRNACSACHAADGRGPGVVTKVTPLENASATVTALLPFGATERPYTTAGATVPLLAPEHPSLRVVSRLPPAVFGRGYLEAIAEEDLERLARAAAARAGSARGRPNRMKDGRIGRFGIKARLGSLRDFAADALNGDMGVTSPLRPDEPAGPEGLRDDDKPGVDFSLEQVELLGDYLRGLEIPARRPTGRHGRALFDSARCSECHVPAFTTARDYPVKALSGVQAEVYTDLLLHDMGPELADGVAEDGAGPREFRTAPLIGLRFLPSFLHDGRAKSVEQAIVLHGEGASEARDSVARFRALAPGDRAKLVEFVEAL